MSKVPKAARGFASRAAFRAWLVENHARATELVVRCVRTKTKTRGLTYRDALDEALCLGWIDGVRRSVDDLSFSVRFSPRRQGSAWSAVNVKRVKELQRAGLMHAAGLQAFRARVKSAYSYESRPRSLPAPFLKSFQKNESGWRFFAAQAPWYRRTTAHWVMSAKQPATRLRRLEVLIARSERQESIPPLKGAKVRRDASQGAKE